MARQHRPEHDLHLLQREARSQAPPPAPPERDPRVRPGCDAEEALGPERPRIGVDLRVVVDQLGAGQQHDAGRIADPADLDLLLDHPRLGVGEHGPQAQDLGDRGRQILVAVARGDLRRQPGLDGGLAREPLQRPCQLRGGRLVSGHERRDELVAEFEVRHRAPVLVARVQKRPEHVIAGDRVPVGCPPLGDQRVDQLVGLAH